MGVGIRNCEWLEYIVVVSGCCKEVYGFPHFTYPYSTCISSFLQQHPYIVLLCSFLKCFFILVYVIFVQYSKHCSNNIRDHSKIKVTST